MTFGMVESFFKTKTGALLCGVAAGGAVGYWLGSPSDAYIAQLQANAAPQIEGGKKKKKKKKGGEEGK